MNLIWVWYLHLRNFKVLKSEGDMVYFQNGIYNKATGLVQYKEKVLPLHKTSSQSSTPAPPDMSSGGNQQGICNSPLKNINNGVCIKIDNGWCDLLN